MGFLGDLGGALFGASPADRQQEMLNNEFRDVGGPQDFTAAGLGGSVNQRGRLASQFGNTPQSQFRGDQSRLIQMLQSQANGAGPGQELARLQASQQAQSGIQNQLSQAAGQRGGANPLAARMAAQNSAGISGAAGQQAVQGGLQAQLGAIGQLGGVLQGARGQDQSLQQLRQQGQLGALQQQLQLQQLQQQGLQAHQNARTQRFGNIAGIQPAASSADQFLGAAMGVGSLIAGKPGG